jgi:hypothetical protein
MARGRSTAWSGQEIEKVKPDEMDGRRKDMERLP